MLLNEDSKNVLTKRYSNRVLAKRETIRFWQRKTAIIKVPANRDIIRF